MNQKNPIHGRDYQDAHISKIILPEEALDKIAKWLEKPEGMLVFIGNPGIGKTYLCSAIINKRIEDKKYFWYFNEGILFSKLRSAIQNNQDYNETLKSYCENEFMILDDVGVAQFTEWQKEVLMNFIDFRSINRLPTVITSNLWIDDLSKMLHPRVISRLKDKRNCVIEMNWIDKRQDEF